MYRSSIENVKIRFYFLFFQSGLELYRFKINNPRKLSQAFLGLTNLHQVFKSQTDCFGCTIFFTAKISAKTSSEIRFSALIKLSTL